MIYGVARPGTAIRVQTVDTCNQCYPESLADLAEDPYKKSYALPIRSAIPTRLIRFVSSSTDLDECEGNKTYVSFRLKG